MSAGLPGAGDGVAVAGLRRSHGGHEVLAGVDLVVAPGSLTAILGPSGSGKTTLLRLLAGFDRADAGTITVAGRLLDGPGRHVGPASRGVGYVPQEGSLFPHLDVAANVGFGVPRAGRRSRVAELLEVTGLTGLGARYPHQLSGGQQQRVALARALAPGPSLVLLDEPFSSLDAALRASVRADVARVLADAGTTAVLVTHDQDEALSMADEVAVLRAGRIAQAAPPRLLYTEPADADLAGFVGAANLLPGVAGPAGCVDTPVGRLALLPSVRATEGAALTVLVRPEELSVAPAGDGAARAVVTAHRYHGRDGTLSVALGGATLAVRHADGVAVGTTVGLAVRGAVFAWPAAG